MNESRIDHAKMWAGMHHKGQVRKYTGEPYIEHPLAVSELVKEHGLSETAVIAAILHDVVEDTGASMEDVEELFGEKVAEYVWYLTKPPAYVGDRVKRKTLDRNRLSESPEEVRIIKFFDIYHNAGSIKEHDTELWETWRYEMAMLLLAMDVESIESLRPYNDFIGSL
jgi:(p)ppGpp synthase/HD superfamily hydrolase